MFLAFEIFLGQASKCLDRFLKTEHATDHVAKFRGDRSRDFGDLALKKTTVKHKA